MLDNLPTKRVSTSRGFLTISSFIGPTHGDVAFTVVILPAMRLMWGPGMQKDDLTYSPVIPPTQNTR